MKHLFFDLETTGTDYKLHGIHQISGIIEIDGEYRQDFNFKVRPHAGDLINAEALKIGNVTLETIREYPEPKEIHSQFTKLLSKYVNKFDSLDKFFLCGYNNASFDTPFLRQWFEKCGDKYFGSWFWSHSLDVIVLATEHLKHHRHLMPNFQLRTVAKQCGIPVDEAKLHDALYDISLTKQIYDCITSKSEATA
jgi:DNA polymerase-3 subunit epsilon